MKLLPFSSIEPLESRIAPAIFLVGRIGDFRDPPNPQPAPAPAVTDDLNFNDLPFHSSHVGGSHFDVADTFGANFAGGAKTFYLKLSTGDVVKQYGSSGYQPYITVKSGNVVAFFTDKNSNNEVDSNELTGLSLGAKTSLAVGGDVDGDVVTNFSDLANKIVAPGSLVSSAQSIASFSSDNLSKGDASTALVPHFGSLISGGSLLAGDVKNINDLFTGTAANGYKFSFNYTDTGAAGLVTINTAGLMAAKVAGPGVFNLKVNNATLIQAGDGGAAAVGGALSHITVSTDTDGITLRSGAGGAGTPTFLYGGAGGGINTIFVQGQPDATTDDAIQILSGGGGAAGVSANNVHGGGGAGGLISSVYVGFDAIDARTRMPIPSSNLSLDHVLVKAGNGGAGAIGGAGGSMNIVQVSTNAPAAGHEITVVGGVGGMNDFSVANARAGLGGSLNALVLKDLNEGANGADILVTAGNAGATTGPLGNGNGGGSVTGVTLITYHALVTAGDASASGNLLGGNGGGVSNVVLQSFGQIVNQITEIDAGVGGNTTGSSAASRAGNGGNISGVQMLGVDLSSLNINGGTHGNGGSASTGFGGKGGSVFNVQVFDVVTPALPNPIEGDINVRSGAGGNGTAAGGAGGLISASTISSFNMNYTVQAGAGGNSTAGVGRAGAGGSIANTAIFSTGQVANLDVIGTVAAGNGGVGSGFVSFGGAGGRLNVVSAIADGEVNLTSGNGGSGSGGAPGVGGAIFGSNADSARDSAVVQSGNAGTAGTIAAVGGSILSTNVLATADITITAGNGGRGGAGGSLGVVGYSTEQRTAPEGLVSIHAGQGSNGALIAGAGGSIAGLTGFVGLQGGLNGDATTVIAAGNGGGVPASSGAGGNVSNVRILGGGLDNTTILTISAGDGGTSNSATLGGHGGNVAGVAVDKLETGTLVRSIAAGNGGAASASMGTGGIGGTITNVHVLGDIGARSGLNYGYASMGGLFAGAGGTGNAAGKPGSVIGVTAQAISAIVAGRDLAPQLANIVDGIFIGTIGVDQKVHFQPSAVNPDGSFTNFNVANIVGAVVVPTAANANTFHPGTYTDVNNDGVFDLGDIPQNGLIAAITLTNNRNFVPEAHLFAAGPGGFFDYKNGL